MDAALKAVPRRAGAGANTRDRVRTAARTEARRRRSARSRAEPPGEIDDHLRRGAPDCMRADRDCMEFAHHALALDAHAAAILWVAEVIKRNLENLGDFLGVHT